METVTPTMKERGSDAGGLFHANQVAAFDYSERQSALAARVMGCARRAFDAIGASSSTQEIIFWNLYVTRGFKRDELVDKPAEFIDGLKAIYGEAGEVVFEYMMTREIKREFGLTSAWDKEPVQARSLVDLLHTVAYAALESQCDP